MKGEVASFRVPERDKGFVIDPKKAAIWKREHSCDSTSETYQFLELAKKHEAKLGGLVRLTAAKDGRTTELNTFDSDYQAQLYLDTIEALRQFIPDASITLTVEALHFPSGRDLEDFANELPLSIGEGEVEQAG